MAEFKSSQFTRLEQAADAFSTELTVEVDVVVDLDARQRQLAAERDDLRSRVKALSKEVGRLRKEGLTAEAEANQAQSRELGDREQELADEAADEAVPEAIKVALPPQPVGSAAP